MNFFKFYFIIITLLHPLIVLPQANGSLTKPDLKYQNDTLFIKYSFENCGRQKYYKVWIGAKTMNGKELSAQTLSGDVGEPVLCNSEQKVIYWDLFNDSIFLDDAVTIKVYASPSHGTKKSNYFLSSLVLPGSGIMLKKQTHKPYWLMGVAGYAGLSVSLHFYLETQRHYRDYTKEPDLNRKQVFYDTYKKSQSIMKVSMISTGTIWVTNLIWTLATNNPDSPKISLKKDKKMYISASVFQKNISGITFKYEF